MGADALGVNQERAFPTALSLAAAPHAQFQRLCGPSSAVPHHSDSVRSVIRSKISREDCVGNFWKSGGAVVLLAAAALSRALRARLVDCAARLFGAVFVSHEHGEGAAICDHFPGCRDSPVFPAEILAAVAA